MAVKSVEGPGASGAASPAQHQLHEDAQALLTGTLFVALGVVMFRHTGLLTGGTAGLAFLLHYATGWNFSLVFFLINLPFYGLAYKRMGWVFTLKTFAAVALLAVLAEWVPQWVSFGTLSTGFAAIAGGFGWRAGQVQMVFDCAIVLAAFAVVDGWQIMWSVVGAVVLNMTLAINHRPGRYMAV